MTPLEKAADAVFEKIWPTQEWEMDEALCRAVSLIAARAVIASIEPDDAMVEAAARALAHSLKVNGFLDYDDGARVVLKAFLRSLLEGETGK